jgi:hypothetical protein
MARKTHNSLEHHQPAETEVEGEIRESCAATSPPAFGASRRNESEMVASNINSLLQRAAGTSVQEIDKLITELETLRDMLHSEAARVQREIVEYATLTQGALQSTKIIAESLTQWKKVPDARRLETEHLTSPSLHGGAANKGVSDRS